MRVSIWDTIPCINGYPIDSNANGFLASAWRLGLTFEVSLLGIFVALWSISSVGLLLVILMLNFYIDLSLKAWWWKWWFLCDGMKTTTMACFCFGDLETTMVAFFLFNNNGFEFYDDFYLVALLTLLSLYFSYKLWPTRVISYSRTKFSIFLQLVLENAFSHIHCWCGVD